MTLMWRDGLSTGNDVIDTDHKYLIDIVNLVERSMGTKDQGQLTDAFHSLRRYATAHFAREERIARAAGYANAEHLHQSHEGLIRQLEQLELEIGQQWTAQSVGHFGALLRAWLIDHVIKEDLLMKPTLQKQPASFDAK